MVRDPNVDAVWVTTANFVRVETVETVAEEVTSGRAELAAIAVEKTLVRNLKETRAVSAAITETSLLHGYLENQVFAPRRRPGQGDPVEPRCPGLRRAVPGAFGRGTVKFANAAGALVAARHGCADDMPTREEVEPLKENTR